MTTVQALVLAAMDRLPPGSSHHEIAHEGNRRPGDVFSVLCDLEAQGLVRSTRSSEIDRFGRPVISSWTFTKAGQI